MPESGLIPPVFLRAYARSGGTLFVTMLGCHPKLALSYEIYPEKLVDEQGDPLDWAGALTLLGTAVDDDPKRWVGGIANAQFRSFVARARRAGLEPGAVLEALREGAEQAHALSETRGQWWLIEQLMRRKARQDGKPGWGGKTAASELSKLSELYPDAAVFSMVRDGRDVLASRRTKGSFDADARRVADEWRAATLEFQAFMQDHPGPSMEVRYESLVADPESMLRAACNTIGMDYDPGMLEFARRDLPLYRNPHGHLSAGQIQQGLNADSIGRYRSLPADALEIFESVNADLLSHYGYV